MQYSLFTHGNALRVEAPWNLADFTNIGWGTVITFQEPVPEQDASGSQVWAAVGPGSWFHLPLTSTLTTFGLRSPRLDSVTLLFETSHCRITNVHVYDGARIVQQFNNQKLKGTFLDTRDTKDINPESASSSPQEFSNTLKLRAPHKVFSAIGLSFYACAYFEDFDVNGRAHNLRNDGPFPPARLTVAAVGGQFLVEEIASRFTEETTIFGSAHVRSDK